MFPKDSAFGQRQKAMDAAAGQDSMEFSSAMPPLRTPEENQRIATGPKGVHIPLKEFEDWLDELDSLSDMRGGEAITDLKIRMQSFLR